MAASTLRLATMATMSAGCMAFVTPSSGSSRPALRATKAAQTAQPSTAQPVLIGAAATALGLAAVVTRTSRVQRKVAPNKAEEGWNGVYTIGVCLPLTEKFDPLNLGYNDTNMIQFTAAEIKHGRVAMLAAIGYIMPDLFRFPGTESFGHGLSAFSTIPVEGWVQMIAFIGAHEILVKPRADGIGAYDFGLGTELIQYSSQAEFERRSTVERNNGRLAMVATAGLLVQDYLYGKPGIEMLGSEGWWGPPVDWIVKDIPPCANFTSCALPREKGRKIGLTAMMAQSTMSPAIPYLKYPKQLEGWVGGEKGFDPLGVTDALPVYLVREAELKHGRIAMLATVGWIATDLGLRFQGEAFSVSTLEAHNKLVEETPYMALMFNFIGIVELYSGWLGFEGWQMDVDRDAGEFFLGKQFLPKDKVEANKMRLKELENGRLAMFAISGIATQAALTGKSWPFL